MTMTTYIVVADAARAAVCVVRKKSECTTCVGTGQCHRATVSASCCSPCGDSPYANSPRSGELMMVPCALAWLWPWRISR